jgi:hypothetical protein
VAEPYKHIRFADSPTLTIGSSSKAGIVTRSSTAPLKGVPLTVPESEGDDGKWDDNFLDLIPG